MLAQWRSAGAARLGSTTPADLGFAVTPTLREWYRDADADELEHAAQTAASLGALELLALDPAAPRRRVVLAVDVDDSAITLAPDRGRAAVTLSSEVPSSRWGSALLDDLEAAPIVEAVLARLAAARESGDSDDLEFALGEAEAQELGWYAIQELPYL
jgi:hypothetical protein